MLVTRYADKVLISLETQDEIRVMQYLTQRVGPDNICNMIKSRDEKDPCVVSYQRLHLLLQGHKV